LELVGVNVGFKMEVDGYLVGFGAVVVFVPQIMALCASVECWSCGGSCKDDSVVESFGLDRIEHGGINFLWENDICMKPFAVGAAWVAYAFWLDASCGNDVVPKILGEIFNGFGWGWEVEEEHFFYAFTRKPSAIIDKIW
jgi:hypothetical protein